MENGKHAEDLLPLHVQQGQVEPAGGPRLHGLRASVPAILAKLRLRALTYYSTAVKAPIGRGHGAVRGGRKHEFNLIGTFRQELLPLQSSRTLVFDRFAADARARCLGGATTQCRATKTANYYIN